VFVWWIKSLSWTVVIHCCDCYQVNRVLDLVPTAISLLDRLRVQADRIRQLGSELSVNISKIRSQIDVARDQANLVSAVSASSWSVQCWRWGRGKINTPLEQHWTYFVKVMMTLLLTPGRHYSEHSLFHRRASASVTEVLLLRDRACGTLCHVRYDRWPATDSLGFIWKHIYLEYKSQSILCAVKYIYLPQGAEEEVAVVCALCYTETCKASVKVEQLY